MLVDVYHAALDKGGDVYRLDLVAVGEVPAGYQDVATFLSRWAGSLRFDYLRAGDLELGDWGYFIAELSREIVHLGIVPEDTYEFEVFEEDPQAYCSERRCYGVFVNKGSPLRHFYLVSFERDKCREKRYLTYRVKGIGVFSRVSFEILIDFFRNAYDYLIEHYGSSKHPNEIEKEAIELNDLVSSNQVYTRVWENADPEVKRLFEKTIARAEKDRSKMQQKLDAEA